jgi:AraC family transcriptional regulator
MRDDPGADAAARSSAVELFEHAGGASLIGGIAGREVGSFFAARWRFDRSRIPTANLTDAVLVCRTVGTATVTRSSRGATLRRRPAIGSISYVCPDTPTVWCIEGRCESCHVYVKQKRLREFACEDLDERGVPEIDDLFAVEDPWLKGYFQMLLSEFDATGEGRSADALFVTQAEQLLLHHLVQRHSRRGRHGESKPRRRANPLTSWTLRRIEDYIDANLAHDIGLRDLAAIGCMSAGHFLRAFRASSGVTPYQYVLQRRLYKACDMLRSSSRPVAGIAHDCGFKTTSHLSSKFRASFGTSPSQYRALAGAPAASSR